MTLQKDFYDISEKLMTNFECSEMEIIINKTVESMFAFPSKIVLGRLSPRLKH